MKKCLILAVTAMLFLYAQCVFAQSSDEFKAMQDDVEALKKGQKAIQKELQEIKELLTKRSPQRKEALVQPEFKEAIINIEGDPFKGNKNAKLAVIEFSDYQ